MYVKEYLGFIADVHEIKKKKEKIAEVIETVGLLPERGKKIGQLSKGYKQRVGLAAALIHDPEVLILDEPTSGLDPNQIIEIREVIRNLGKNKTVLFSSHILQEIEAICNRVIIIHKGKLVADDQLSNLQLQAGTVRGVMVQFKETIERELLESLKEVLSVQRSDAGWWTLQTSNPEFVRKQLMELSLSHNLNIVSLQNDSRNLEDIFRSLTN
jgi:ABC-2 type transport system ATP-binding protein